MIVITTLGQLFTNHRHKKIQGKHILLGFLLIKFLGETKNSARVISVMHYVNLNWGNVL